MPRLPSQDEIDQTAKTLVDEHGDQASRQVVKKIAQLTAERDMVGVSIWREISKAVRALQARKPEKPADG